MKGMSKHKMKTYVYRLTEDEDHTLYKTIHNNSCFQKIYKLMMHLQYA